MTAAGAAGGGRGEALFRVLLAMDHARRLLARTQLWGIGFVWSFCRPFAELLCSQRQCVWKSADCSPFFARGTCATGCQPDFLTACFDRQYLRSQILANSGGRFWRKGQSPDPRCGVNLQVCRASIRRGVAGRKGTQLPEPDDAPWGRTNRRIGLRQAWTLTPRLPPCLVPARPGQGGISRFNAPHPTAATLPLLVAARPR